MNSEDAIWSLSHVSVHNYDVWVGGRYYCFQMFTFLLEAFGIHIQDSQWVVSLCELPLGDRR